MASPLVSAIMLTTAPRRAAMLQQAVCAFLAQTYQPMELVIVNDGAPLRSLNPRIRIVRCGPNSDGAGMSIGAKRNEGVRAARGSLVATWDDDDFSLPERIETQVTELLLADAKYHRTEKKWIADPNLRVIGCLRNACYETSVIDRDTLLGLGAYPDLSYLEDMEVYCRLALRGIKRVTSQAVLYVHRRHGTNVSSQHSQQSLEQHAAEADRSDAAGIEAVNRRLEKLLSARANPAVIPV